MKKILFTSLLAIISTTVAKADVVTINTDTPVRWHPRAIYNALTTLDVFNKIAEPERFNSLIFAERNRSSNELCSDYVYTFYGFNAMPPVGCAEFIDIVIKEQNILASMAQRMSEITHLEPYEAQLWDKSLSEDACKALYKNFVEGGKFDIIHECAKINSALEQFSIDNNTYEMSVSDIVTICNSTLSGHDLYKPEIVNEFCFDYLRNYAMLQNQIVKDGGYNKIPYFKTAEESNTPRPVRADVKPAVPVQKPEQKPVPVPEPEQKDDKPKSCLFEGGMLPHHSITETKDIFICNKYRTKTDLAHAETCACDCYDGEISCYTTSCEQGYEFDGYACISTTQHTVPMSEPEQEPDPVSEPEQESNGDDIMSVEYKEKAMFIIEGARETAKSILEISPIDEYYRTTLERYMQRLDELQRQMETDKRMTAAEAQKILETAQDLSREIELIDRRDIYLGGQSEEDNEEDKSVEYERKREIQEKAKFTIERAIEQTEILLREIYEARRDRRLEKNEDIPEYLYVIRNKVEEKMDRLKTLQNMIHRDNITKKEATQILNEAQALSEEIKDLGNRILEEVGSISLVKFENWN